MCPPWPGEGRQQDVAQAQLVIRVLAVDGGKVLHPLFSGVAVVVAVAVRQGVRLVTCRRAGVKGEGHLAVRRPQVMKHRQVRSFYCPRKLEMRGT